MYAVSSRLPTKIIAAESPIYFSCITGNATINVAPSSRAKHAVMDP